ncbi:vWA domain-containing protein [Actinophytocola gossypii]|uniref:VWA domain-containing protein n=1 Tax=Actinophytocola gossypii TaxID=2812003 RepID=A0ABT2J4R6_9PSEU|nr:VWA domain-containing protein [Actinophytocola gossypii]MCT2582671.1 VWA domain-containing protein [Actinophytocola gossypii]
MQTLDPLPGLVGFAAALRAAGLPCDAQRVGAYLGAVRELDLADPTQLYWAGRLTLCADPDDLPRYDDAFAAWFSFSAPPRRRPTTPRPRHAPMAALTTDDGTGDGTGDGTDDLKVAASDVEVLRHRDVSALTPAEREHLRTLIATLRLDPPLRRAMRHRPHRTGRLDAARILRAMRATGGEPVRLARKARRTRPRRLVLLVDVSGSMTPYADALLRFAHAVTRAAPASTEVFTVGTRLTRLTRQLRARDPDEALAAAARAVPDFAGGTRLGETLRAFLDRWGQRGLARRAVVVLFSDGWERGDASLLGTETARLRRLAHAVLWVNPHAGRDGYAPVQAGIAAALPHVDRLLAGHSLATLEELLREVRRA